MKFIFDQKTNSFQMKLEPEELELAKTNPESFKALLEQQNKAREAIANNLIEQIKEQNKSRLETEKIHIAEREATRKAEFEEREIKRKAEFEEREQIRQQELELERLNVQKSQLAWDRIIYGGEVILDKVLPDQTSSSF